MRSAPRALSLALVALCALLAGLLTYQAVHRSARGPQDLNASQAAAASQALGLTVGGTLALPGPSAAPAATIQQSVPVPQTLPNIRMPNLHGTEVALREYLGHPLIINFWATWCPPCRREMPLLQQLWIHDRSEGLQIVGIAVDSPEAVNTYLRQTAVGYPLLVGEQQGTAAAASFGIEPVLPFSVFADAKGDIVAVKIGELHRTEADYIIDAVQQVTQGRETLPQARVAIASELRKLAIQRAQSEGAESATGGDPAALSREIGSDR